MNEAETIEIAREAIFVMLQVAGPLMLLTLAVGVIVSLFQALTQIQEQTLLFVPKIVLVFLALIVLLPFMLNSLTSFTTRLMDRVVSIG